MQRILPRRAPRDVAFDLELNTVTGIHLTLAGCVLAFLSLFGIYLGIRHDFMLKAQPIRKDPDALDELHKLSDRTPD